MYDCKNNDIIKIGDNYELLLLLVNANEYGLKVAENFMALEGATNLLPMCLPSAVTTTPTLPIPALTARRTERWPLTA